jgi:hypothetical protein
MCIPNHGNTISFWEDLINGRVHSDIFPHLMGFAKDPRISLWALRQTAPLLNCFRIPMSREAYNELLQLQNFLEDLYPVDQDGKDSWIYIWGQHRYSSSKYYHYHFRDIQPNLTILWIWKSKCIPKIKFFAWLLLNDRLNTRNILRRRRKFLEDGVLDGGGEGSGVPGKGAVRSAMVEKGWLEVEGGADVRAPSVGDWERGEEKRWAGGG